MLPFCHPHLTSDLLRRYVLCEWLRWMDSGHASPRSCSVEGCGLGPVTAGHADYPVHSPCFTRGQYVPAACVMCTAWVDELRATPLDQVRWVPAWSDLRNHLVGLSQASLGLSPRPNLSFPKGFAAWYPSLVHGVSVADSVGSPGVSRTPPPSPAPVISSPVLALSSRMSEIEACMCSIQESLAALTDTRGRDAHRHLGSAPAARPLPPPKRSRVSSPLRPGWLPPAAASPSDAASARGDVEEGSGYGDDFSVADADDLPPSASLGWEPLPEDWVVPPGGGTMTWSAFTSPMTGRPTNLCRMWKSVCIRCVVCRRIIGVCGCLRRSRRLLLQPGRAYWPRLFRSWRRG